MANEKQEIVLEIQVQGSIDNLAKLRTEMDTLIKTRQDLTAKSKEGDIEATKEIEKVNSAVRNMQTEYKAQQRVLDGYNASVKTNVNTSNLAANSIQQNRDLLKQLTAQYIQLKAPSANATSQIKHLSDVLKEQEAAIGNTSRNVGNYKEAFSSAFGSVTSAIPALKGFQTAQLGVNAAMEANPIGAVVLLLSSLFEIFSKNKAIADQITFAIAGLEKGFGSIIDTIVDTVTNFDKLTDAIAHPLDFIWNLGKGAAQAAKEGYNASKAFDELTVANAKLNAEIGVGQERADALTKSLKDRTKSEKERIAIANQIADLEVSNAKKLSNLRQKELDALNMQNKDRTLSGEEQAKVIEKQGQVEIAALQAVTVENQRQTRINILLDKQAVDSAKDASKNKIQIKQDELKSLDEIIKKEKDAADKKFDDETNRELDAQVKSAQITAQRVGSVSALVDAEIIARNRSLQNEKLTATERENIIRESEDRIKAIKENSAKQQNNAIIQMSNDEKQIYEGVVSFIGNAVSMIGQAIQDQNEQAIADDTAATNQQKDNLKKLLDAKKISKKEYDQEVAKADAELAAETKKKNKEAWEANQAIQITMAVINTAQAIIAQLSNPTPYVGFVLAALAAATGAAQIAIIASQAPPKFATGVIGLDGEGTETSDSIDAKLSRGESVMTAKATKKYHRELAWMEMSVGNSPNYKFGKGKFASGFIPTPNVVTSDGGFAARDIARNSDNSALIQNAIKNGFALAPAPVLSIVEFQDKQKSRNRSVNISEA